MSFTALFHRDRTEWRMRMLKEDTVLAKRVKAYLDSDVTAPTGRALVEDLRAFISGQAEQHIADLVDVRAEALREGWAQGYVAGGSHQRRAWSDEPALPDYPNPYQAGDLARGVVVDGSSSSDTFGRKTALEAESTARA